MRFTKIIILIILRVGQRKKISNLMLGVIFLGIAQEQKYSVFWGVFNF
jgi:hypothetical protein